MVIIGFVLFVAAVVIAVALIAQNGSQVTVRAFDWSWDVDMRWLFVAGLALTAIALLGLVMMSVGGRRARRIRAERRALAAENRRLSEQGAAPAGATTPGYGHAQYEQQAAPRTAADRPYDESAAADREAATDPTDRYTTAPAGRGLRRHRG